MAENSKISWTDHTMNFWIGCVKVSAGCKNCYAAVDTFARRERSHGRELWGPGSDRHRTSAALWKKPYSWNKNGWVECVECGWRGAFKDTLAMAEGCYCPSCEGVLTTTRQRVFVSSLSDICEEHPQITKEMREEIVQTVKDCENLDFLFLTKRPQNFNVLWLDLFGGTLPDNLWVGTTCENQEEAAYRIPELMKINAKIRFLSCEPLLGHIGFNASEELRTGFKNVNWVIAGGESGSKARPMLPVWARSLRDQCAEAGIPFHFKQWGEYNENGEKVGKKNAGRLLDSVEHNGMPK